MGSDFAIIISSCNDYSDVWQPTIDSLYRNIHGLDVDIFLVVDFGEMDDHRVKIIQSGVGYSFGARLKRALGVIEHEYVLFMLDDFALDSTIYVDTIKEHLSHAVETDAACLYIDYYKAKRTVSNMEYTLLNPVKRYCMDLSIALWRKAYLQDFLLNEWSPWDFERNSGLRYISLDSTALVIGVSDTYRQRTLRRVSPAGIIMKGEYTLSGYQYMQENGYATGDRNVQDSIENYLVSKYSVNRLKWGAFYLLLKVYKLWKNARR